MPQPNHICHRCVQDESFPTLLKGSKGSCYTCEGVSYLSQQHSELFNLGFAEEVNLNGVYSMELYKELGDSDSIIVKVERVDGEFKIVDVDVYSPSNADELMSKLVTVELLIEFLKAS